MSTDSDDLIPITRGELKRAIDSMWMDPKSESVLSAILHEATTSPSDPVDVSRWQSSDQAATRLADVAKQIDDAKMIVSDNLANVETIGFKSRVVRFGVAGELDVKPLMEQGALQSTTRALDVAIQGPGFFCVKRRTTAMANAGQSGEIMYTRCGNFFVNSWGMVVLGAGDEFHLDPPIAIPPSTTQIDINEDGAITCKVADSPTTMQIGSLNISTFVNAEGLKQVGGAMYIETADSGPATVDRAGHGNVGRVFSGFLEASNVDLTREQLKFTMLLRWRQSIDQAIKTVSK